MTVVEFLASLKDLGIKICRKGNQLCYRAPKGVMTSDIKEELLEQKTKIIEFLKEAQNTVILTSQTIKPVNRNNDLPLSFPQQRLWFLHQLDSQNPFYNESCHFRIVGALNVAALEQSINEIIRRHESLRTIFTRVDELPVQRIIPSLTINLPVRELQSLEEAEVQQIITREVRQPFDLSKPPLLRFSLLHLGAEYHLLILTLHHIIIDGGSMGIFIEELSALYQAFSSGSATPLPELAIQYGDFTVWQRQWLTEELQQRQIDYWKDQLVNAPRLLELTTDYPRPSVQTFSGAINKFKINSDLTDKIQEISQQSKTTIFVTLLAAFAILLHRYSGQDDICIGSPFANRNRTEIESLIGFFVNTLVLRTQMKENPSFSEFVTQVQQVVLEAYAHQDVPFDQVVEAVQPERSLSYNPLCQVMFVLENFALDVLELPGISLTPGLVERGTAQCDLSLSLWQTKTGLLGSCEYNTDLFKAHTIDRMVGHYQILLEAIAVNPDQPISELSLLTEAERQQLLVEWNNTWAEYPQDKCVHQLFEAQVERSPNAVAGVFEGEQLTYRELNVKANQLAHYLGSLGVGQEVLVGICVERSLEMVVGLLGILKAGGAYVPLDPTYPRERLAFMLEDTQTPVLLTKARLVKFLPPHQARVVCLDTDWKDIARQSEENPTSSVLSDNLAYIIYTSGSTGKPKGVAVPHKAVNRLVFNTNYINLQPLDVVAQVSNCSFDAATFEIWGALLNGARLVVITKDVALSPKEFADQLREQGITVLFLTTALFNLLASEVPSAFSSVQHLLFGGEAVELRWVKEVLKNGSPQRLLHVYGPTESTTFTTWYLVQDVPEGAITIPIGCPISNTQVYLLDEKLQLVPIGVPGELYVGGDGLALGYLNRPDLTPQKFIKNPFSNESDSRLYKTGDLACYLSDGNIEFLGRIDHQVKIRGFRIELGEIEAVLSQHPGVGETVVIARENVTGDKQLVAYIVPLQEPAPAISDLRRLLKQQLPEYMMPSAFVVLEALPITPNGKVDRRALPAPDLRKELEESFAAPQTPIEEMLASIWGNLLSIDSVGVNDNFFTLGGHSLLATQVISRVRDTISIELPLRSLFEAPTIAEFASRVEIALKNEKSVEALPLLPIPRSESIPLSFAQTRLWFLDRLQPDSAFYNIPLALRLFGQLNIVDLESSINEIIRRHEALRTNFATVEGQPVQVIASTLNCQLQVVNLLHLVETEREIELQRLANEEVNRPFNLEQEPLLRGIVLQLGETEYVLLLTMHHIISDGWSLGVFIRELTEIYQAFCTGKPPFLLELPVQYADFAIWQRQWLTGEILETQLDYWKEQLKNAPDLLELPTDRPRPAVLTFRGGYYHAVLPQELSAEFTALSKRAGVTMFMTLCAAFVTLLYRYSGQDDIVVGTPVAGRNRQEIEGLIGFFVNTLVLRTDLSDNPTFEQLLNRVREVALQAYAHQDLPFEQLVEALQPTRDLSYTPLFQVMFALDDALVPSVELPDLTVSSYPVEIGTAKFDLTLSMQNTVDGLVGVWEYNTDLFDEATIARMVGHFQTLVEAIVANPIQPISELPLLTEAERQQLLIEWNNTFAEYPQDKCIHQLFEEQVERTPEAVAVVFEGEQLTYRELNARGNQLAHYLRSLSVGPEVLVGICVERSLEMVVGLLGILKAGGAYVPLDPAYPSERLAFMLEDNAVPVLLTQEKLVEKLPQHSARVICLDADWEEIHQHSNITIANQVTPKSLAYVMYTSGSTGQPKGVSVIHRGVVRLVKENNYANFSPEEVFLQLAPICFDASTFEIWGSLLNGARLVVMPPHTPSMHELGQTLKQHQVTTLWLTSGLFYLMVDQQIKSLKNLRQLLAGGDVLSVSQVQKAVRELKGCRLINGYGPTENTTFTCCYAIIDPTKLGNAVPIGRPISNTQVYLLDKKLQPVPIGVPGELYIGGDGLARGYLNRPDLTAEKFIPNPFTHEPGERLYKTGDKARYLPDGNIEFLGRIDNQVKIRGFRIELGEIEAVLSQHPGVRETVVIARENVTGDKQLVAYFVPHQELVPTNSDLRRYLKEQLPEYMVPSAFVGLQALPVTPNGKVDRRTLHSPELRPELELTFVAPRTPIEEMLANIWACVLGIEQLGIHDNFFELGGHSLLATQIISRVRDTMSVELPLRCLFEAPTVATLAERVENSLHSGQFIQALPLLPIPRSGDIPLSFAQARLWFLDQLQPNSAFYNIPFALRLSGQLNIAALESSLNEIICRHEVLRTNFTKVSGQPIQVIASTLKLKMLKVDLQNLPFCERELEAQRLATTEAQRPFDLEREPLVRAKLLQLDETEYVFLLTLHHIIFDGWSTGVFYGELAALYEAKCTGKSKVLPELPVQYADFAVWQRYWLTPELLETQLNYGKQQLLGAPALLELPTDRPRKAVQSYRGAYQSFGLSLELSQALANLSKRAGVTLFMTLYAAFVTLLYRYTGSSDIVVGTPVANRNRQEIEGLIGFFVNTLALRTDLSANPSFEQLLRQVREVALQAYAHQDLPFEQLVEALQPERSLSYTPLFQVMFALDENSLPSMKLPDLTFSSFSFETGTTKFDLTLSMENTASGLIGGWEYNSDLFDAATIARYSEHFLSLLEGIVANPIQAISELPLLTEAERQQLLIEWNNTFAEYPQDKCIHQLFEAQVDRSPDAVAVVFEDKQLTYRELNAKSNQLAHYLQKLGVKPEVLVGIYVERSLEMLVGILGILKAGGAYIPFAPDYPQERLVYMLADSQVSVLLTQEKLIATLPKPHAQVICLDANWGVIVQETEAEPVSGVQARNLAYIIYTSGSTGKPKGTMILHQGLVNYLSWCTKAYAVANGDGAPVNSSISFDATITSLFSPLLVGRKVVLMPEIQELESLSAALHSQNNFSLVKIAPAQLEMLSHVLPEKQVATQTKAFIIGGEALSGKLVSFWQTHAPHTKLINEYGPTETVVGCCVYEVSAQTSLSGSIPIGRPIANTQLYILDRYLQPVPIGVFGELHIGGAGVARGYLNRPELTEEKFIPNPFSNEPGSRLYKTGDKARYLLDGNIEFLGRIDNQVKIRGFRIELGEIETALAQHPDLRETAVICREDTPGNKRLVAYVVSNLIPDRIPYHSKCQLELDGNTITLHTEDISTGGVGLVGVPASDQGKNIRLHLQLPGEEESRWLSGTVVWSRPPQVGICFHLTPSEQAQIDKSMAYQLDAQDLWKTLQPTLSGSLRDYLKQKLPDYMIPSAFVLIKALPLTPNGKIDRRALPAPDNFHNEQEDKFVAPGTPTEAKLVAIWAEVLGLKRVGINDNFFELGGHSLLATQIISRMGQAFALELPLRLLFEAPTIASLGKMIELGLQPASQESSSYSADCDSSPPLVPATREGYLPLSLPQEYIWHAQELNPHSSCYNSGSALRFILKLSSEALEKSINEIIRRHEIMRTTFPVVEGQPVQAIAPELTLPLKIVDLQNIPLAKRETEAVHFYQREMNYHFDLANGPLIKTTLVRLSSEEHWLLMPMHHIITDNWSTGLFVEELETLYTAFSKGLPSPLPEMPLQYADFTFWQRQRFNEEVLARQLNYWLQKLAAPLQTPEYQPDREPKPNPNSGRASSYSLVLRENIVASLEDLRRSHSVTISTIIIAALKLLLFKWSGQSEIMILATIGNRSTPEIEKMLGCFINDVILRSLLDDEQTGATLLEQVKQTLHEAIANKEIPLQQVIEAVKSRRKLTLSASVGIVPPVKSRDGRFISEIALDSNKEKMWDDETSLDLYISSPSEDTKSMEIYVLYSPDLFGSETIERMFNYYQEILQKLAESPQMKIAEFEGFQEKNREAAK